MSNHCSILDLLALSACGAETCVPKANVAKNIFFGPMLKFTRSILARKGGASDLISKRYT